MSVQLNHTIVWCRDQQRAAPYLVEICDVPSPTRSGPFLVVHLDNGVSLDFDETDGEVSFEHYAFLIDEEDFDDIFGRIRNRGLEHWADPGRTRSGEINRHTG